MSIKEEQIKKLLEVSGKVRGQVFLTDKGYLRNKKGKEALKKLQAKINDWEVPLNYQKVDPVDWYSVGMRAISLLAMEEVFGWEEKDIFELGKKAPRFSFIVKMIMKTFVSTKRGFKEASNYWKKHYTVGSLESYKIDEEEKYMILRLKKFKVHPILCPLLAGYLLGMGNYIIRGENQTIKETKCMFKGDPFHEYKIEWE